MSRPAKWRGADLRPWCQLLRLPNLLSVPGDPWAGLALAGACTGTGVESWHLVPVALVSLCLYAAGLVLNDLHDETFDREHRPERPLPSGHISRAAAARACVSLTALGLLCALPLGRRPFQMAFILAALVYAYNLVVKGHRLAASVCMGLCRGCSLLLGASVLGLGVTTVATAFAVTVYIAAVTWMAAGENETQRLDRVALLPGWSLAAGAVFASLRLVPRALPLPWLVGVALLTWAGLAAVGQGGGLRRGPVPPARMQPAIGGFIRNLIPWQAGLVALGGMPWLAVLLVALCPPARRLARHFAES